METQNRSPTVPGSVVVGPMSRTIVESGKPPELTTLIQMEERLPQMEPVA
jgi:hypothetical protein